MFWFELTRGRPSRSSRSAGERRRPCRHARGARQVRRHTLLYVEDNPANLKLVEQIIARHPRPARC